MFWLKPARNPPNRSAKAWRLAAGLISQGTGLGLSICDGIIRGHGGQIRVSSVQGAGAAFTIVLPQRLVPPTAFLDQEQAQTASITPPRGRHILLVDDDLAVVAVVGKCLGALNEIAVAGNGVEALRLLPVRSFDLLLCDLKMPEMDGESFYTLLRATHPKLARSTLFLSGDTSSAATCAFLADVGRPLLAKPFTADELFAAIANL